MPTIQATVYIEAPISTVFELLADLRGYNQWLATSETYNRIDHISDPKPKLGTVYSDIGAIGRMIGRISLFVPPYQLTFQQSSAVNLFLPLGNIDISIHYHLQEEDTGTRVNRIQDVKLTGVLKLFENRLARIIQKENIRILEAAQAHLEGAML